MSYETLVKSVKKDFISILGILLGLIFGILSLYYAIHEKVPKIIFQVESESNILDYHKPVNDLKILFMGDNIEENKKNLKYYLISIKNIGEKNVTQNDFDQTLIWGLEFKNAKIIDTPQVVESNSEYIKNNLNPQVMNEDTVKLSKIILESNKFAVLEIKVIYNVGDEPEIVLKGKIAGIENQILHKFKSGIIEESFWTQIISGSIKVQIGRFIMYFIGFIILIIILALLNENYGKFTHSLHLKKVRKYLKPILSKADESGQKKIIYFFDTLGGNKNEMIEMLDLLKNEKRVKEVMSTILQLEKSRNKIENVDYNLINIVQNLNSNINLFSIDKNGEIKYNKGNLALMENTIDYLNTLPNQKSFSNF